MDTTTNDFIADDRSWQKVIMKYNRPDLSKSLWQICNSLIPYLGLWYLMVLSLEYSYWITLALSFIASGFLIRLFIIFHDCGHGSFFKSKRTNKIVGMTLGILAFTPYFKWHNQHHIHHATTGNLDKRGIGDVWTLTVKEYLESSKWRRFFYRAFRNPFILFTIGSAYVILIQNRFSKKEMTTKERWNIYFTNFMILVMAIGISLMVGLKAFLLIQLPVIFISHSAGLWLFYIQHQFEDVSWYRSSNWDYKTAAIEGSSFLKLPVVLQWFTGNIGFHQVHHLGPGIPNYNLARCQYENDLFKKAKPITLFSSFKALRLNLWDEASLQMIRFRKISLRI
jgi:acyl-lipid omega-6 desaturase (Delta-12 desaturase)